MSHHPIPFMFLSKLKGILTFKSYFDLQIYIFSFEFINFDFSFVNPISSLQLWHTTFVYQFDNNISRKNQTTMKYFCEIPRRLGEEQNILYKGVEVSY